MKGVAARLWGAGWVCGGLLFAAACGAAVLDDFRDGSRWKASASDQVQASLRRDARDADRDAAPLRVAEDAVVIDTTALDADAAFRAATDVVDGRGGPKG